MFKHTILHFITEASCTAISVPDNGAVSPSGTNLVNHGTVVTITCEEPAYTAVGGTTTTCTDGSYTNNIEGTTCGELITFLTF